MRVRLWLALFLALVALVHQARAEDAVQEYAEHDEEDEEEELLYGDEEEEGDVATELPGAKHSKPHGQLSLKVLERGFSSFNLLLFTVS